MDDRFSRMTLRLPMNMRAWLEDKAKTNHRTLTSEVVEMIRETMKQEQTKEKTA